MSPNAASAVPTFKDRVKQELQELESKLLRLDRFLSDTDFDRLPKEEQKRLTLQRMRMQQYAQVLQERLACDFK